MRVVLYLRVSTDEQAKEGYSLESQLEKLKAFCFSQGWEIVKVYREEGQSAKNTNRPQLKKMLSEMHTFDVVLVYKLDRLSRSVADINELLQTFEKNEVAFKSATEPYDTTTAQGKLLINIFASLAQFEREQLAERVILNMTKKATLGERNGGRAPFGYRLDNKKITVYEKEAIKVREMFQMYLSGKGIRAIAIYLKKDIRTVSRWLENPVYAGKLRWGNNSKMDTIIIDSDDIPPIIDEETFDKVQELRAKNNTEGKKATSPYHFSGVLRCARCGSALSGYYKKERGTKHYLCINKKNKGQCDLPQFTEVALTKTFLESISPDDPDSFFGLYKDYQFEIKENKNNDLIIREIEKELNAINTRKKNWLLALGNGTIKQKDYTAMTNEDSKREELLLEQLSKLTPQEPQLDREAILALLKSILDLWDTAGDFEKKSFTNELFESIFVDVPRSYYRAPGKTPTVEITEFKLK